VAVPLVGPVPTPDPRSQARVQISQVYYTSDQSEVIVVGSITNPTGALIPVGTADIVSARRTEFWRPSTAPSRYCPGV